MEVERSARRRAGAVLFAGAILFVALFVRLFEIQVLGHEHYTSIRNRQSLTHQSLVHVRGRIYDRNGDLMALSVPVPSVFADPQKVPANAAGVRTGQPGPRFPRGEGALGGPEGPHA